VTQASFRPVRAVVGQLRASLLRTFIAFWIVVGGCWAVIATVIIAVGHSDASVWHWFATSPSKYFLMVIVIITTAVYLPVFIGHGVTRRQFALGAAAFFGGTVLAFAGIVLLGYVAEVIMYAATGQFGVRDYGYPLRWAGDGFTVFAQAALTHAGFVCTGWLIGASFYRFGPWLGTLLIPPCALPGFGTDLAFGGARSAVRLTQMVDIAPAMWRAGFLIGLALVAAGVGAGYLLVRDVAVRKVSG
jgi:hypothetical protein